MPNKDGKSNSLLVNYAGYPYTISSFMLDNGLALLAAILHKHGHKTRILDYSTVEMVGRLRPPFMRKWLEYAWKKIMFDSSHISLIMRCNLICINNILLFFQKRVACQIYREIRNYIIKEKINFIGFKLWNGDGMETSEWVAKKIKKEFPEIKIFGGGPQVDMFIDYIVHFTKAFDLFVYGDGEQAILGLAEYACGRRSIESISNIIYRDGENLKKNPLLRSEDINSFPPGDYSEETYPSMKDDQKLKVITVEESRGCKNRCAFCIHPIKSGGKNLAKDEKILAGELETYIRKYNIDVFQFSGSNSPHELFDRLADEILRQNIQLEYSTMAGINIKNKGIFTKMKKSGAFAILFGVESGSDTILRKMRKPHNKEMIKEALTLAKDAGLYVAASFIYPAPFDNAQTLKETLELIREVPFDAATGMWGIVMPGTDWANHPELYCIKPDSPDKEKWIKKLFRWKVAAAYPPAMQMKLPYKLNGLDSRQCALEHEKFFNRIREMGFLTTIGSAEALAAKRMGMEPKIMQDIIIKALFVGDTETIHELINTHNKNHLQQSGDKNL